MAILSLRAAAQEAGTSKSTILRATQSGRLSAPSTGDGGYAIDSAELFRVYPPKAKDVVAEHSACRAAAQVARREALYSSAMADWRRQRDAGAIIELQKKVAAWSGQLLLANSGGERSTAASKINRLRSFFGH